MSRAINAPLIAAEQASKLLDEIVYERVLSCIDLGALFHFELDLWIAVHECGQLSEDEAREIATQMIDRALHRIADDDQRYAILQPFGQPCDLCEEEEFAARRNAKQKAGSRSDRRARRSRWSKRASEQASKRASVSMRSSRELM